MEGLPQRWKDYPNLGVQSAPRKAHRSAQAEGVCHHKHKPGGRRKCVSSVKVQVKRQCPFKLGSEGVAAGMPQGRPLKAGDLLPLGPAPAAVRYGLSVPNEWLPQYPAAGEPWHVGVLPGPNGAPDYFTRDDVDALYTAPYTVHYNS